VVRGAGAVVGLALALGPWILRRGMPLARLAPAGIGRALETASRLAHATPTDVGLSLALWGFGGAATWAAAQAVGLELGFGDVWLLLALQLPLQLLPVQGLANTGSHELSWVTGLAVLGVPADDGLRFALASHALIAGYVATLAPLGATVWLRRPAPGTR